MFVCDRCGLSYGECEKTIDSSSFNNYPWTQEWTRNFPRHVAKATHALRKKLDYATQISGPISSMLDVGCGNGAFLAAADALGIYSEGTDIDETHVTFAQGRGFRAFHLDIRDYTPSRQFDFIHVKESFHLVTTTRAFVERIASFMDDRSVLYIDSTHADGLAARFRKWRIPPPRYGQLYPPLHNRSFNRKSLGYVLEAAGLRVVRFVSFNRGNPVYCPTSRRTGRQYLINPLLDAFGLGGFVGCYAVRAKPTVGQGA